MSDYASLGTKVAAGAGAGALWGSKLGPVGAGVGGVVGGVSAAAAATSVQQASNTAAEIALKGGVNADDGNFGPNAKADLNNPDKVNLSRTCREYGVKW